MRPSGTSMPRCVSSRIPRPGRSWTGSVTFSINTHVACEIIAFMRSLAWLALALAPSLLFAQKKPFDSAALLQIQRIGDPQLSPDGKTVAFAVSTPDVDQNKSVHTVWSVPLEGGTPRKLAD